MTKTESHQKINHIKDQSRTTLHVTNFVNSVLHLLLSSYNYQAERYSAQIPDLTLDQTTYVFNRDQFHLNTATGWTSKPLPGNPIRFKTTNNIKDAGICLFKHTICVRKVTYSIRTMTWSANNGCFSTQ